MKKEIAELRGAILNQRKAANGNSIPASAQEWAVGYAAALTWVLFRLEALERGFYE